MSTPTDKNPRNPQAPFLPHPSIQPYPAAAITMDAPVDSLGERFRDIVEFDLSSPRSYAEMVAKYPRAWELYYNDQVTPEYSPENAIKLRDAIRFFLYITTTETINVDETFISDGVFSQGEQVRVDSVEISPFMRESGGTYRHPNAFSDVEVYNRETVDGTVELPLLRMASSRLISERLEGRPHLGKMYSSAQLAMTEYEISRATPGTEYDQFGPYATGRNTF